jgi:prolyl oligopeptidase
MLINEVFSPQEFQQINVIFQVFRKTVIDGLDLSLFELNQVFYPSKDGTMIPMFIASRKDIVKKNNTTPCLLYGYGGFNISLTPE